MRPCACLAFYVFGGCVRFLIVSLHAIPALLTSCVCVCPAWRPPALRHGGGGCGMHAGEVISRLGEQLEEAGMAEVFAIPRARMPVVKFVHPGTGALDGRTGGFGAAVAVGVFCRWHTCLTHAS